MEVVVKKAEIRSSLFLSYEYDQKDTEVFNTIKTQSDAPIHDDLRNAFRALTPHFALICEEIKDKDLIESAIESPEEYFGFRDDIKHLDFISYRVHGFTLSKNEEGIIISGAKQLATGNEINFTTPRVKFDSDYEFGSALFDAVENLKSEILQYMSGKQAEKSQLSMFEDEDEENVAFIEED
jgi:hypothetical protein